MSGIVSSQKTSEVCENQSKTTEPLSKLRKSPSGGLVQVIGLGPGDIGLLAPAAREAIEKADLVLGYKTYLKLIANIAPHIPRQSSGMRKEVDRARDALKLASEGKRVALVSSGDSGIYGMAGLVYEVREESDYEVEIEVLPGISALNAAASLLGAPLMTDFAVISLSDQLTPRADLLRRVELVAQSDFILCLYNPKGRKRVEPFELTCDLLEKHRPPETPVGVVRHAYREKQEVEIIPLSKLRETEVNMVTIIIVGNSSTRVFNNKMITPRGYEKKYKFSKSQV